MSVPTKPKSSLINPGPGFRIKLTKEQIDQEVAQGFAPFASPDISDQLNRLYALSPEIRLLTAPHHRLIGPATTVKVFPGDNLMVHKVLDVAEPGDVVVIDAGASRMNAVLGDLISTKAQHRGIAGFVVDGYVRDLADICELDFPVFARGTTPIGPLHRGPGEINYPVCCGGVVVNPGDLVVADVFGLVIVPRLHVDGILQRMREWRSRMEDYLVGVKRGEFSNAWVDDVLEASNIVVNP